MRLGPRTVLKHPFGGYLAKYSPTGSLLWTRELLGTGGGRIRLDAAGNIYLSGNAYGNATSLQVGAFSIPVVTNLSCGYIAKLDAQGQPLWLRTVGASATGICTAADMDLDASGNIYMSGRLTGTVNFGSFALSTGGLGSSGPTDAILLKLDPQGTPLWGRQGARTSLNYLPALSLTVSAAGDSYLTGSTSTDTGPFAGLAMPATGGFSDVLLVKYDTQGTPQWLRRYPTASIQETAHAYSAVLDGLGRLVVPLEFKGHLNLGSQILDAGGAVRNGALATFDTATGNLVWVSTMQSPAYAFGYAVTTDAANNSCFVGEYSYSTVIGGQTLTYANGRAGVVACFSPQGSLRWVKQTPDAIPYLVATNAGGQLSVGGNYQGAPTFDGTVLPQYNYTLTQSNGMFVAQFGTLPLAVRTGPTAQPLALYPNPAHTATTLLSLPSGTHVQVTDALGRTVYRAPSASALSLTGLAPGLYYVQATAPTGQLWRSQLAVE
ncbi:T9SS type A sorting domain-containing protein [Hymenobacter sp. BT559]|uniref:T9SS type A sorting domain-containing protein n=1 Tax=Hymenobacter sp. BT559 TaxID=2795729 RepID=UPI0018ECE26E|nr:T9SS type A sorting domain-containing protein [Hymenobacter sp. BT559]MBJ6142122.1 T9SS type A sorting domain-containing protein [Hymenobacter sp. BT559]